MEQNNESNQNQTSIPENVSVSEKENTQNALFEKDLEVFKQDFLAAMDAKLEKTLSMLMPKPAENAQAAAQNNEPVVDEITVLKNKIEQMEKFQQSFLHHDLGSGKINPNTTVLRNKSKEECMREYSNLRG